MNVLVVAAHPDDEVLGAGGAIAAHVKAGDRVTVAILGEGLTSRGEASAAELAALHDEARRANAMLGCEDVRFGGFPDNRFDSMPLLEVVQFVEGLAREVRPEVVYTHFHGDLNVDHLITARAVQTAFRPLPGAVPCRLLAFEVPSATGWGWPEEGFSPTVFRDIGALLEAKLAALEVYAGEMRPWPHARSIEGVKARALAWGSHVGIEAAEPYRLVRELIA